MGRGVEVEAGVGIGRSRPFCLESESDLESVKFRRLRLRSGVAEHHSSTGNDFGRMFVHRPENIEREKEKENGCMEIKLKSHLVTEFHLIKGFRDNSRVISIVV